MNGILGFINLLNEPDLNKDQISTYSKITDLFIMDLYPFGRKAFRFELDPILHAIREKKLP